MRIFSKFKDYYDSVAISKTPVYTRTKETHVLRETKPNTLLTKEDVDYLLGMWKDIPRCIDIPVHRLSHRVVGFCGEIILVYVLWYNSRPWACIDYQSVNDNYEKFYDEDMSKSRRRHSFYRRFNQENIERWLKQYNNKRSHELFISLKCPIFKLSQSDFLTLNLQRNSNLRDINFQRIVDPFQAYQRIEQFLSNDLADTQEKSPDFGDILKRDAHGFDNWSFKQVGPKVRKRRKTQ